MYNLDKKLKYHEAQDYMSIEFSWYSPTAYFFLFFTIIWNAFLFFWYSMAFSMDAPFVFTLFPLIHVAVGLYLMYFTLCQFVNKTNIEIDDDYLTIRHSPIPWWRGNVSIPTGNIDQLYVREDKSEGKNGTTYTYALRAKLTDNTDKEILSITGVENAQMLEIEEQLERFIGINDRPVKGEYAKNQSAKDIVEARRHHRNFTDSPLGTFYFSEKGELFSFKEQELKVLSVTQYDWNDGNSDKLLQLSNENGEEKLLYFDQNKALLNVFEEEPCNLADVGTLNFNKKDPPKSIEVTGQAFQLSDYKPGKKFILGAGQDIDVEQWVYLSADQKTNIRVINNKGLVHYYKGTKTQVADFEDTLDLKPPPERDIEYGEPGWKEEDLV